MNPAGQGFGLHYLRRGAGMPLVLIQGTAATHLHWGERLPSRLARSFDVVAYDHRGAGRSDPVTAPFTVADLADDAARLLDVLKWDAAMVFGVSLGGLVAQELALRHPDRVLGLVLGCTSAGRVRMTRALTDRSREVAAAVVPGDPRATTRNLFRLGVRDPESVSAQAWREYEHAALASPVSPRCTVLQIDAFDRHTTAQRLPELDTPTEVVHGDSDRMIDISDGRHLASLIPGARFTTLPAGHLFWLEQPEATAGIVARVALAIQKSTPTTEELHAHSR
jgi:3-oxoadipate enol-lactonase